MSSDFAFWKAIPGDPEQIYDPFCEGITTGLLANADVLRFREELLRRLPELKDELSPAEFEPEDIDKYVVLTLAYRSVHNLDEILDLAEVSAGPAYSVSLRSPLTACAW